MATRFSYDLAFERNLGWVTEAEQLALRGKRVAIAGMGGVGGVHLLTLARLGIGAFHIADLDTFELANFNRQIGATVPALGRPKALVLKEMALALNPELRIKRFDEGIDAENIDEFLKNIDLFVDRFDFFELDIRARVFDRCAQLGIPAVTAAPIGMGTAFLIFKPGGMGFEQYFRLRGQTETEQYLRFLIGLTTRGLHRSYLVDPSRLDLAARKGPSTVAACQLCAGVTAVAALKLLLRRGKVKAAPYHHQYDAYRGRLAVTKLPFGNAGPIQRTRLALARRAVREMAAGVPEPSGDLKPRTTLEEILNAGRWAPSGDNEQPWRFEICGDDEAIIHLVAPSAQNVYEYRNGEPLLLAGGMLLECLRIASTAHARRMEWRLDAHQDPPQIAIRLRPSDAEIDPLYASLGLRSVDRRPFRTRALTERETSALEAAIGDELVVDWFPERRDRWRFARLSARATDIRLRTPEAFRVHQRIIDWRRDLSPVGIPARALGLDAATLRIMRWGMGSWNRTRLLNILGGTMTAALQMDYAPILRSAAFFSIRLKQPVSSSDERVKMLLRAGQQIQRFWLTATRLGLAMQPALAILIFSHYGEKGIAFTTEASMQEKAKMLASAFKRAFGAEPDSFVFMGRIGEARPRDKVCRSTRLSLDELMAVPKSARDHADGRPTTEAA